MESSPTNNVYAESKNSPKAWLLGSCRSCLPKVSCFCYLRKLYNVNVTCNIYCISLIYSIIGFRSFVVSDIIFYMKLNKTSEREAKEEGLFFKESDVVFGEAFMLKEEVNIRMRHQKGSLSHLSTSVGEVANLLQRSRKEASVVEVEAEAEDEVEAVAMDEVGIPTAATSTTTRKEKAQQEAVGEAIQTRGTINLKEEPSLTIEVKVSYSSAIPLIQKVTSYTTRTTKSL
ncbi:hypothetical protein ACOSP7_021306 [Xanthoceras sorbifolium]